MGSIRQSSLSTVRTACVAARRLVCVRGGRILFGPLDLAAQPGEAISLTGPNGIGKSSLLRILAGLLTPAAGDVTLEGSVSLSDDRLALDEDSSLIDALAFWAGLDGAASIAVDEALNSVGMRALSDVPVRMLSTGQRKRASLARVVASDADIWLLDEPANGLDSDALAQIGAAVLAHRQAGGIVIAASHVPLPWTATHAITLARPAEIDARDDLETAER